MKYFNHLSCAGEDSKVQSVRDEFGLAGYGAYFLILEKIAAQIRKESGSTSMSLALRKWAQHLDMSRSWTLNIIKWCDEVGLWSARVDGDIITIDVPNLLKYADEYSKKVGIKSRHSPDRHLEIVPNPGSKEVRKDKRSTASRLSPSGADAPEPQSEPESEEDRERGLKVIKEASKAMFQEPSKSRVVEPKDSGNGTLPTASGPEVDKMYENLGSLLLPDAAVTDILNAWWANKQGTHNEYALASMLDKHSIKGHDRTKIYQRLGVV